MTSRRTTGQAFGDAAAAMVGEHTVADVLTQLLEDCAELVSAETVALMLVDGVGELSLLSSSSHGARELEMLQTQRSKGPCIDSVRSGRQVSVTGVGKLVGEWDEVGRSIARSGFESANAYPMRWQGKILGGLSIYRHDPLEIDAATSALSQAFADVATLVVVQSTEIPSDQIAARVHGAIMARAQVEQAKGVLAYVRSIDMASAYQELRALAEEQGRSLSETAARVVQEQHGG